jgi:tRNA (guanine-N7-)-methyltransferase
VAKRKLERFAELDTLENIFQPVPGNFIGDDFKYKDRWAEEVFKNKNPITLELGCGKGEYSVGLAEKYHDRNFIGVDIKGERLWKGCKAALSKKMNNVFFLRTQIELIGRFFGRDEISEIWITFPDPQPNKPRIKKRLTSPSFLERYDKFLISGGTIHLKTDNTMFFDYTLETIREEGHELLFETHDLYDSGLKEDATLFKTYYEEKFTRKGCKICYLKFRMRKKA